MAKINEQLQDNLTKVVSRIFTLAAGKWVNARDYAISKICEEYNVDRRYSTAIGKVLRDKGLMFSEGEKSGMKYKINTNINPVNFSFTAQLIIEQYRADMKAYNDSRKSDDYHPVRNKVSKPEIMPATFIKRTVPHLGDMMFVLFENQIVECKIVCKKCDLDNEKILLFDARIPSNDELQRLVVKDIPLNQLFESIETLTTYLHKHIVKFK